jgi:hypothetical protein
MGGQEAIFSGKLHGKFKFDTPFFSGRKAEQNVRSQKNSKSSFQQLSFQNGQARKLTMSISTLRT